MSDSNEVNSLGEIKVEEKKTSSQQTPTINEKDKKFVAELCREGETSQKTRSDNIEVPKIQKVPGMLLSNPDFKKFYKPTVMSIGPLHHASPWITAEHKHLKRKLASKFVKDSGADRYGLLGEIKQHVDDLKRQFNEDDVRTYDDDAFAQMLFLDGCAVLQFISSLVSTNLKEFKINSGQAVLIQQDLLMLENQIPYRVLKLLIKKLPTKKAESIKQCVEEFILLSFMVPLTQIDSHLVHRYSQFFRNIDGSANQPAHLLDFLRLAILLDDVDCPSRRTEKEREEPDDRPSGRKEKEREEEDEREQNSTVVHIDEVEKAVEPDEMGPDQPAVTEIQEEAKAKAEEPRHIIPLFAGIKDKLRHKRYTVALFAHPSKPMSRCSFRNVQDLRASGIRLRPSNSPRLRDVKFSSKYFFRGELKLPALVVDDSTSRKLLNLVAFEMCPDNYKNDFGITSYLSFLDSLIDIDQDVKYLRKAHILRNHLTSDSDVTQLFNTIGSNLFPDDTFFDVKSKIQNYYERRSAAWMAQFCRDHFKNPWTILALLAGTAALTFAAVQTWFSVSRSN